MIHGWDMMVKILQLIWWRHLGSFTMIWNLFLHFLEEFPRPPIYWDIVHPKNTIIVKFPK